MSAGWRGEAGWPDSVTLLILIRPSRTFSRAREEEEREFNAEAGREEGDHKRQRRPEAASCGADRGT